MNNVLVCGGCKIDDCEIGEYTYISGSEVGGVSTRLFNTKIGKFCSIGHNVEIINASHFTARVSVYSFLSSRNSFLYQKNNNSDQLITKTIIGNDVWICSNVKIIGDIKIGDGAIIAAGAVVTKDVEPYTMVGGVPAKFIKKRFSDNFIDYLLNLKWWDKDPKEIENNISFLINKESQLKWK